MANVIEIKNSKGSIFIPITAINSIKKYGYQQEMLEIVLDNGVVIIQDYVLKSIANEKFEEIKSMLLSSSDIIRDYRD